MTDSDSDDDSRKRKKKKKRKEEKETQEEEEKEEAQETKAIFIDFRLTMTKGQTEIKRRYSSAPLNSPHFSMVTMIPMRTLMRIYVPCMNITGLLTHKVGNTQKMMATTIPPLLPLSRSTFIYNNKLTCAVTGDMAHT